MTPRERRKRRAARSLQHVERVRRHQARFSHELTLQEFALLELVVEVDGLVEVCVPGLPALAQDSLRFAEDFILELERQDLGHRTPPSGITRSISRIGGGVKG